MRLIILHDIFLLLILVFFCSVAFPALASAVVFSISMWAPIDNCTGSHYTLFPAAIFAHFIKICQTNYMWAVVYLLSLSFQASALKSSLFFKFYVAVFTHALCMVTLWVVATFELFIRAIGLFTLKYFVWYLEPIYLHWFFLIVWILRERFGLVFDQIKIKVLLT